jgi:hypothetical protein
VLGLCNLPGESLDPAAEPAQNLLGDVCVWPKPGCCSRESFTGERPQTLARLVGSGNEEGAQLVERCRARLHRASTLEQEQAQVLAPAATARKAEPVASEQPWRGQSRVDQVALSSPALPPLWTLALPHRHPSTLKEVGKPSPIAAGALNRERGQTQLQGPAEQGSIPRIRRLDLAAIKLGTDPIKSDRDMHVLVRVNPDCHCALHHLASSPSNMVDRPGQGCVGQGRRLRSGHRPVERNGGGRQVHFKASRSRQLGCESSRRRLALSAANRTETATDDPTQLG